MEPFGIEGNHGLSKEENDFSGLFLHIYDQCFNTDLLHLETCIFTFFDYFLLLAVFRSFLAAFASLE